MLDFIVNYDFSLLFSLPTLLAIFGGTVFGILIGSLPGLTAPVGCALLIPFSYYMDPSSAVPMLAGLYMGSQYGGSISAVVLGIPGTGAAVTTVLDGYPLAQQGQPGRALGFSLYASTFGGVFGCLVLMFLTGPLAALALHLSDPELFLIGLLGLLSVTSLGLEETWKSIISLLLGLMLGIVGLDPFVASPRFTFGNIYLNDGIALVALLSGLYAMSEVYEMVSGDLSKRVVKDTKNLKCTISRKEFKDIIPACLRSSVVGSVFGIIPGLGAGSATWFAYAQQKRVDKSPETFGNGNPRGLASAESSNNACVGGGLVPLLSLGIPGTAAVAVISGAFIMQGIIPGPHLMRDSPNLVYTIYWGLLLAIIIMFIFGRYATSLFARILICPNYVLVPIIIVMLFIGSYVGRYFMIDVWFALGAGAVAYIIKRANYSLTAFTLAFVLAGLIELRFRRSLMLSDGSPIIFFNRPLCIVIWLIIAYMIFIGIWNKRREMNTKNRL